MHRRTGGQLTEPLPGLGLAAFPPGRGPPWEKVTEALSSQGLASESVPSESI